MKQRTRIFSLFLVLLLLLAALPISVSATSPALLDGSGTVHEPYLIGSVEDLILLRTIVHEGDDLDGVYFLQTADLDLATHEETKLWEPIGTMYDGGRFFYGIYNGGGHVIKNLNTDTSVAGLFSFLGGTVMNLGIESGHIRGDYAGAITSHATGGFAKILNCYSLATVEGIRAGGLADNFYGGTIADSFSAASVTGSKMSGGIVAFGVTNIIDSYSLGTLEALPQGGAIVSYGTVDSLEKNDENLSVFKEKFAKDAHQHVTPIQQQLKIFDGDGSRQEPYTVTTVEQLSRMAFLVNIGNGTNFYGNWFVQKNDLDLATILSWNPIGTPESPFCGTYDGRGYHVSNLRIRGAAGESVGLFGTIYGTILNLGVESGTVEGDHAAGLVGRADGTASMIINCYNRAEILGKISAAGIANSFEAGLVVNCLNTGRIEAGERVAGICVGNVGRMQSCFSVGTPVSHAKTEGIIKASCAELSSAEDAAKRLNDGLYDAATVSNYQRNNLIEWSEQGGFSGSVHNYVLRFILRELLIALVVFALAILCYIVCRTSLRTSSLRIAGCKETLALEKNRWLSHRDAKIQGLVGLCFLFALGMLLVGYLNHDSSISKAFSWPDQDDAFMDFFNPLHTVLNSNYFEEGHYTNPESTYPPIIKGILWLFGQLLPNHMHLYNAKGIRSSTVGLLVAVIAFMLCYFILLHLFRTFSNKKSNFLPLCALFSSPMIFLLDRGNTLFFVLVLSALFIAGYRSKSPVIRHLSYVCLGLAAAIKIYPAALGLLVIREKKLKHTLQCIVYGVVMCLVPFLLIGVDEIFLYIRNVTSYFGRNMAGEREWLMDYTHILMNIASDLFDNRELGATVAKMTLYPFTLLLAGCAILSKDRWRAVLAVILIQILFPGFSVYYCASLFAIPLLIFIGAENKRRIDYVYGILLALTLVPLQFLCGALGWTQYDLWQVAALSGFGLAILLIVDCAIELTRRLKARKQVPVSQEIGDACVSE